MRLLTAHNATKKWRIGVPQKTAVYATNLSIVCIIREIRSTPSLMWYLKYCCISGIYKNACPTKSGAFMGEMAHAFFTSRSLKNVTYTEWGDAWDVQRLSTETSKSVILNARSELYWDRILIRSRTMAKSEVQKGRKSLRYVFGNRATVCRLSESIPNTVRRPGHSCVSVELLNTAHVCSQVHCSWVTTFSPSCTLLYKRRDLFPAKQGLIHQKICCFRPWFLFSWLPSQVFWWEWPLAIRSPH